MQGSTAHGRRCKAARLTDGDAGFAGIDNTAPPAACTALVASAKIRGGGGLQGAGCKLQQRQHAPRLRVAMSVRRRRTGPGPASVVLAKTCSVWARDLARERLVADESSQRSTMKLSRA
ncbi:hypothetical protein PF008_g13913 [Phytophthora fragariae]|uniref:Uncharacterized protein n=1 Tax=Phytophthora fragariae TaxID=53985 RepID=A0A6G0RIJ6_9STRA|nr:hypothetical protein PF008_g13913 [Phytophthora fragariae]